LRALSNGVLNLAANQAALTLAFLGKIGMLENFTTFGGKKLNLDGVVREIIEYLREDAEARYRIIVTTDSPGQEGRDLIVPFSTVITFHRIGKGGRVIIHRTSRDDVYTFRDRIYRETVLSITLAQELRTRLSEHIDEDYLLSDNFEVHADVGENGKSRQMVREVMGMIVGSGFNVKIKPDAVGVRIADRFVRPAQRIIKPIFKPA